MITTALVLAGCVWLVWKVMRLAADVLGCVLRLLLGAFVALLAFGVLTALAAAITPIGALAVAVVGGLLIPDD